MGAEHNRMSARLRYMSDLPACSKCFTSCETRGWLRNTCVSTSVGPPMFGTRWLRQRRTLAAGALLICQYGGQSTKMNADKLAGGCNVIFLRSDSMKDIWNWSMSILKK